MGQGSFFLPGASGRKVVLRVSPATFCSQRIRSKQRAIALSTARKHAGHHARKQPGSDPDA
jgi:hypothetical protein